MAVNNDTTDQTIEEFCKSTGIAPSAVARMCGVDRQYINDVKNKRKHLYIIRHDESNGDIQIVKTEKIVCHGNINRDR